ncbi:hypothetical protein [Prochlorococcus marinus]|uniref:hypothetical protein n=1 Tax=Prochlorococcus marinus TaxID=1219 RepID=UPI001AD9AA66|nr:hypothetical protein [Prochlorococcus marinus]MBO8217648.1 hypothetical protein [Prochlorococcus marinus XMU1405]MBW3040810.1 hypothetical protein [Prochlorococcus marinus str. MU1405]MBW3048269.1 hypothetical protein [Prochlorococcus marinus str. MU1406]
MAKRLTEKEKQNLVIYFTEGKTIDFLSGKFGYSKLTISRNLKKSLGEEIYKDHLRKNKSLKINSSDKDITSLEDLKKLPKKNTNREIIIEQQLEENKVDSEEIPISTYTEVIPLNYDFENANQKDLSSIPLDEVNFPKTVFLIIDKNIELETKLLRDYPEWQFLSQDELERKTIQIFSDLKVAKRFCNKEQKVIKVPNTEVFKIVSPLLISRGITRIVSDEILIAL